MSHRSNTGFNLIELMVIAATIGVIAGFGLPAYREYIERARVLESFSFFEKFKTSVTKEYFTKDIFPASFLGVASGATKGSGFSNTSIEDLRYERVGATDTRGRLSVKIRLSATESKWISYVIKNCNGELQTYCGTGSGINSGTDDIEARHLPSGCKDPGTKAVFNTNAATIWQDSCP